MSEPFATRAHVHTGFPPKLAAKGTRRLPGGAHGSRSQAEASFLCLTWGLPQRERPPSCPLVPQPPVLWSGIPSFSPATPLPRPGSPSPLPRPPLSAGGRPGRREEGEDKGRRKRGPAILPCHLPLPHPTPFLWGRSLGTPWFLPPRGFGEVGSGRESLLCGCRKSRPHGCMGYLATHVPRQFPSGP